MKSLKFHNRKDMDISIKFGFVGVGLMGCRVANTIAQLTKDGKQLYPTLGININKGDLDSQKHLNNKLLLKSEYKAAGRDPEIGYQAIAQNEEEVKRALAEIAHESKFIWFVAGLGGGTGTGAILQMIEWAEDFKTYLNVDFGIIVSIPREVDGYTENKNALLVLEQLNEVAANRLLPIILVDNEILFKRYMNSKKSANQEWTEHSNLEIAGLLHQINIITNHNPYASKHFDEEEFRLVLNTGGCIQFAKTVVDIKEFKDSIALKNTLQKSMEEGIASSGYDISEAAMMGISVFAPANHAAEVYDVANVHILEESIKEIAPKSEVRWGQYVDYNKTAPKVEIYSIISGLALPDRVEKMPDILQKLKPSSTARKLNLDLSKILSNENTQKVEKKIVNPFKKTIKKTKEETAATQESEIKIPDWLKKR